ncbi:MAG: sugar transferase [Bacteroidota bacterium]
MKKTILFLIIDALLLPLCFLVLIFLKYDTIFGIHGIQRTIINFLILWLILSLITGKYSHKRIQSLKDAIFALAFSNLVILGFVVIFIKISIPFVEYRFIIIYTVFLTSSLEALFFYFINLFSKAVSTSFYPEKIKESEIFDKLPAITPDAKISIPLKEVSSIPPSDLLIDLSQIIIEETGLETYMILQPYLAQWKSDALILSTTTVFNVYNQSRKNHNLIINLKRINDIQFINKFFEAINLKLVTGGLFIDWVETYSLRKHRILNKFPWGINYLIYIFDFILKRIFPKLNITKRIYFLLTKGENRVLSKAETYGRLYSCGFEFFEEHLIGDRLFFVFKKINNPVFDDHPSYGPLIKLQRVGQFGNIIGVYKLRTMHAYSEYLQGYIYAKHSLDEGGKFKNDFRITTLGRLFRAMWIDELPMLINVFVKRNMKIVGIRPLSKQYFNLYSEELQQKRIKYKPGLVPPYYAQYPTPKTLEEIQQNELEYLNEYEKHPFITDFKYFFKALKNIFFNKARSG